MGVTIRILVYWAVSGFRVGSFRSVESVMFWGLFVGQSCGSSPVLCLSWIPLSSVVRVFLLLPVPG